MALCSSKLVRRDGRSTASRIARRAAQRSYTPLQVAVGYGLPIPAYGGTLTGKGQKIGIVELGGAFSQPDLDAYLSLLKIPSVKVNCYNVAGGRQQPDPGGADGEVMLDICIIAALAYEATIMAFFAPNTGTGIADGIKAAFAAGCDAISLSWGAPVSSWAASDIAVTDRAIRACIAKGVNVWVASGDNGSRDGTNKPITDYPASSAWSIGCGGTSLQINGPGNVTETVWNDGSQGGATGGGYWPACPTPNYQKGIVTGGFRGVPDVCGVADPETGWIVRVNGSNQTIGGTSAVAPLWAAINALLNQLHGKRIGFFNPLAYKNPGWFNDTITGSNGDYRAGPGWDACTGLGSPKGKTLFAVGAGVPTPPAAPPTVPPSQPSPSQPTGLTLGQILATIDQDFAAMEQAVIQQHPFMGQQFVAVLQAANQYIDQSLQSLSPNARCGYGRMFRSFSTPGLKDIPMKPFETMPLSSQKLIETAAAQLDQEHALPPGTWLKIIKTIIAIAGGVFGVLPTQPTAPTGG